MQSLGRAFRNHLNPGVVQCSPVRTGSTLVWNALRFMFPGRDIPKRHDLNPVLRSALHPCRIVATVRDPRDCILSMLEVAKEDATEESVGRKLRELDRHGLREMLRIRNRPRTLFLRYEEIHDDFPRMFGRLEDFFGMRVDEAVVVDFTRRFTIEEVMSRSRQLGAFDRFDPVDKIHGAHVSGRKGVPGGYRMLLAPELRMHVEHHCAAYMKAFGYAENLGGE